LARLARSMLKWLVFVGMLLLSIRYVHTYPVPMTLSQQQVLVEISNWFGVKDCELFYIVSMLLIDLMVTWIVFWATLWLWNRRPTSRP
jgi:hypothetical protein